MKVIDAKGRSSLTEAELLEILEVLSGGGLIVYPTETLYGLGGDATSEMVAFKTFRAKKRPFDLPLSVAVSDMSMLRTVALADKLAERVIDRFTPGPLSVLLPKKSSLPSVIASSDETIAVRLPDHPIAMQIIESFGPIISTSANTHGGQQPTSIEVAMEQLGDSVDIYIDGGEVPVGEPSTIVEISHGKVNVVRYGATPVEKIMEVVNESSRSGDA